jgi:hypothetical protein
VAKEDGSLAEIRRAKTDQDRPGPGIVVGAGSDLPATRLVTLEPGRRIGVELLGPSGYRFRVLGLRSGIRWRSAFEGRLRVIGRQGEELIAGTPRDGDVIAAPLVAIDPATGAARSITTAVGTGASLTDDGTLVWDETREDGTTMVRSLAPGTPIRTIATVPTEDRTLASTSSDARAVDPEVVALVPGGSWLEGGDPDATIVTVDLRTGRTSALPAYEVLQPTGRGWAPLRVDGAADGASLWDVVAWAGGIAVIGGRGQGRAPGMWALGADTSWGGGEGPVVRPAPAPGGGIAVGLIAAAGGRLIAASAEGGDDPKVVLWSSRDGDRWQRIPDQPAFHVPSSRGASLTIQVGGVVGGRPAVVLAACLESCGSASVLTQTSAGRWSRTRVPTGVSAITNGHRRLLAEQERPDGTVRLLATTDGRRWEDTGVVLPRVGDHRVVDTASGPLMVATNTVSEPLTIARTDDGVTWETTFADSHPWDVQAVAVEGDQVVIVGDVILDWDRDVQVDATLTSSDGGQTWVRSLLGRTPVGSRVDAVTIVGEHAVAVGGPHAWSLDLRE